MLYSLVYIIPLVVIILIFGLTLGKSKFNELWIKRLKLISGLMILGLGGVLIFNPKLLERVEIAFGLLLMLIMALTVFTLGADPLTGLTLCGAVPVTFADLEFTDGEDNAAGTQLLAYYILAEDIATLPGYKTDPSNLADYATIDQAFVCKAGKKFNKLWNASKFSLMFLENYKSKKVKLESLMNTFC